MPISYEIDTTKGRIVTRCYGPVVLSQVIDHFRELGADPAVPTSVDLLLDFSALASFPDVDQMRSVALGIRDLLRDIDWRDCAVVASGDLAFGIGRMFGSVTEDFFREVNVFRDPAAAEEWLARPAEARTPC